MNASQDTRRVVITHALRTPIGRYLGSFKDLSAADLGTHVVSELVSRAGLDAGEVGEVVMGNARQAGGGPNVARQIAHRSGLGDLVPAWTMNMACGSGLKAIESVASAIAAGRYDIGIAGGAESMSGLPFFLPKMRAGYRLGHAKVVDAMYQDGFVCPLADMVMGETAEDLAQDLGISREEQDAFALDSQQKAGAAMEAGRFADEIAPVEVPQRKGEPVNVTTDEHPRPDTNLEKLGKLPPVFDADKGTVTAANSSGITDGAAGLVLMSAEEAERRGLEPLATVGECAQAGVDPRRMGIGPIPAVEALAKKNGIAPADYDLVELNEAFAAQVLACQRELDFPEDRLNVNGGAIALGHPIGATGARIVVTLVHEMARRGAANGLATLCISGGMGLAFAFHREED